MLKFYIVPSAKEDKGFVMSSLLKKEKDQVVELLRRSGIEVQCGMGMFPNEMTTIGILVHCDDEDLEKAQNLVDSLELINAVWVGSRNNINTTKSYGR